MQDLVVLAADKQIEFALRGALGRPEALGIRPINCEFRTHPGRDGGVRTSGAALLRGERTRFAHALLVLDLAGCGRESAGAVALEQELDAELRSVWGTCGKAIVIAPEVDVWLWGSDNVLREALPWPLTTPIRAWLQQAGFAFGESGKPVQPKEALDALRPVHREPRSAALYQRVTARISLERCTDEAFLRLRDVLRSWFAV